jgi:ABC transport system ATP-binding/permease protein
LTGPSLEDLGIRLRRRDSSEGSATLRLRTPALIHQGSRTSLADSEIVVGSGSDAGLVVGGAAHRHALVRRDERGAWILVDLGSDVPTELNGEVLRDDGRQLSDGDSIRIANAVLHFVEGVEAALPEPSASRGSSPDRVRAQRWTLGSDAASDVVLEHPLVSGAHAEVLRTNGHAEIRDLGSTNGTFANGHRIDRCALVPGTEVGVGPFRFVWDGLTLVPRRRVGIRLECRGISVVRPSRRILTDVSLSVEPGELIGIIGESGAGKSTLLKALAGVNKVSDGAVTLSGEEVSTRLSDIGYVPQSEIVHDKLTVTEALVFAAELRLPARTGADVIGAQVERALAQLGLQEHADQRIDSLSGGQRRRVGVATELLSEPALLCLDEPTTGLDPALERRTMRLFRSLAHGRRSVVLVTHATRSLGLCDRIAVIGRGGVLTFFGSPGEAREFFGVNDLDAVYERLSEAPASGWKRRFEAGQTRRAALSALATVPAPGHAGAPSARLRHLEHGGILTRRYLKLLARDRRNLVILFGQVPVLAVGVATLFEPDVFTSVGDAGRAGQLLFLLVTTCIWFGSIDAAREVVKERGVLRQESSLGVSLTSYLGSKVLVLFAVAAAQTIALAGIVLLLRPPGESPAAVVALIGVLLLASWAAVGLGLAVSALAASQDQATSFIPLVLIPQLLYSGGVVAIAELPVILKVLAGAVVGRWAFEGAAAAFDYHARIVADPVYRRVSRHGAEWAAGGLGTPVGGLVVLCIVHLAICAVLVRRSLVRSE